MKSKKNLYHVTVTSTLKYDGKSYKETALNTRLYGTSIDQVKRDVKKHYGNKWKITVKRVK